MAVLGNRRQVEELRLDVGLEIEHHANHPRAVACDPQTLDVGILRRDLALQLGERRGQLVGLELEHQPLGILDAEDAVLDGGLRFEREPRVIARGPDAARYDLRLRIAQDEERTKESEDSPAVVCAPRWADLCSPSKRSSMSRSGGASRPCARSGHSTAHSACALK